MIIDRFKNNSPEIRKIQFIEVMGRFTSLNRSTHLGFIKENNAGCEAERRHTAEITHSVMIRLKRARKESPVSRMLKVRLVNALVFFTFLDTSETGTVWKTDRRKIDALNMWCWKGMLRIS